MKKQVILVCEGGQQFGVLVDEMSVLKVMRAIINDLEKLSAAPTKKFLCFTDYVSTKDSDQKMYVKASIVNAVLVANINNSNILTPPKGLFVPTKGKSN